MNDIPKPWQIDDLKQRYPPGTRVRVFDFNDPYTHISSGMEGTVIAVDDIGTVHCNFDDGTSIGLICGTDEFHRIEEESKTTVRHKQTARKRRGHAR